MSERKKLNKQPKQLSLFDNQAGYKIEKKNDLDSNFSMSKNYLNKWKKEIYYYQQLVLKNKQEQGYLIQPQTENLWDTDKLNPFELETHPDQFYDLPEYQNSESCLYFILDTNLPILLYIGETKKSPKQRWIKHDCKSYIQNYLELHRQHELKTTIRSAFWWGIPVERKIRQHIEKELILKWRSPFNKESWRWWGQPFQ